VAYSNDCTVTLSYQVFSEDLLTNPPPGRSRNIPVHLKLSQLEFSG